ncbi:MAG TPA: PAS domain S-box protein [Candidatus Woesebacteria bacterium]|nr:PAS domain S-box protein [Candidatus Woesebacteria bacterium]
METALNNIAMDWKDFFEKMSIGFAVRKIIFNKKGEAVDMKYLSINSVFAKITGFGKEEILTKTAKRLVPDLEIEWYERYGRLLKTGKSMLFDQKVEKLGKLFRVYAVKIDKDKVGTFFSDITTFEKAKELIQESESKYQAIVKSSQDAIVMMDDKGKITAWNPAAERMFDYRQAEVLGKDLHSLIPMEKSHREEKGRLGVFFRSGKSQILGKTLTLPVRNKKGETFLIELTVSSTKIEGKWFAVGVMRDITERKKTEEELKERVRASEILNQVMVDRELKMIELKKEIALLRKNGK